MKKSLYLVNNLYIVYMNRFNTNYNQQNNPGNNSGNNPGNNPGNRPGSYIKTTDPNKERRRARMRREEVRVNYPEEHQRRLRHNKMMSERYKNEPHSQRKVENARKNRDGILRVARENAIDLNP
jgi:hypothetical protein